MDEGGWQMIPVYVAATNIISPLGLDTVAHWKAVERGVSGIKKYEDAAFGATAFYASKLDPAKMQVIQAQTQSSTILSPFEQMCVFSAKKAIADFDGVINDKTLFILSTTKGNIEWLNKVPEERLLLHISAKMIAEQLGIKTTPVIISQACVSGLSAILYGIRAIQQGWCDTAVVTGGDRFTQFVLSGFQSFQAVANEPCRPFDAERKGITLGEAAATVVLTRYNTETNIAEVLSGATTNDANHISGPSRTGEELALAIERTLHGANVRAEDVGAVSAHGTGTMYNDEMEAKAFHLSGLSNKPVHSFKGYSGHTLGAAGLLESIMLIESMRYGQLIPSIGYRTNGVCMPLNVTTEMQSCAVNYALKTASGFGGSNGAMLFKNLMH
jgi:3-oxoacyl-[acyl-carrier-protein] synthase-1